jgi:hypothetical protein
MMSTILTCLRIAGAGLILLALLHVPIARYLQWRAEAARMSQLNATVFHVHNLFLCLVLLMMGVPCVLEPQLLLENSRASAWGAWSLTLFWAVRWWCQWFVYQPAFWRGRRFETAVHWWCTLVWTFLVMLFGWCACWHAGWVS